MSREVDDFFNEIETKIPDEVSRLVEKQMDIAETIADAIRNSNYKTRKEFAAAIGMKESMLSRILAGNVNLTLKTITKIESVLKTEIISVIGTEIKTDNKVNTTSDLVAKYIGNQSPVFSNHRLEITNMNMENKRVRKMGNDIAYA